MNQKSSQLLVRIGETCYGLRALQAGVEEVARVFRLTKVDGTLYDVALTDWGARCDCADFIYRRDGIDPTGCKHIKALVAGGLLEADPIGSPTLPSKPAGTKGRRLSSSPQREPK